MRLSATSDPNLLLTAPCGGRGTRATVGSGAQREEVVMPTAYVNRVRLFFEDMGAADIPLVLVHGCGVVRSTSRNRKVPRRPDVQTL